ncbi:MAG: hypothetical protein AB8G86_18115, partial [Saprospiraceae bacterium]
AISWTYIIIAELLNRQGGIGSLAYIKARQGQMEKVFAILIVIIIIGFLQDKLFTFFDRKLFPHKYRKTHIAGIVESQYGIMVILILVALALLLTSLFSGLAGSMNMLMIIATIAGVLMMFYGEFKLYSANKES